MLGCGVDVVYPAEHADLASRGLRVIALATTRVRAVTEEELALCCASHSGEPRHVALAASLGLSGAGFCYVVHRSNYAFKRTAGRCLHVS